MATIGVWKLKLVQLNAWWGGKIDGRLADFLKEEDADVLCLQEASSYDKATETGMLLPVEKIKQIAGFKHIAFAPMHRMNFMSGKITFGNAILSKVPLSEEHVIYTNLQYKDDFDFEKDDFNVRNLLHCQIKVDREIVHILTHHGHHIPHHKNGNKETMRQMQEISDYISTLNGPIILTGDFNLAPRSKSIGIIEKKLTNLSTLNKLKTTRNILTNKSEVCDYIFVNGAVKVSKFVASDAVVSDHMALIMEFDI